MKHSSLKINFAWAIVDILLFGVCLSDNLEGQTNESTGENTNATSVHLLPEWIKQEGIRAGFFSATCDTDYNLKMKTVGLNTSIPTRFVYDLNHLRKILKDYQSHAYMCEQLGMHMFASYVWQPGGQWKTPKYRSVVFSDGSSGLFPCPLDDSFWQDYLINIAVQIAKLSTENSCQIDGIFLDMEMYGTETVPNKKKGYSSDTCFCDSCFSSFILDCTEWKDLPPVSKDRRKSWLSQNGFLSDYYTYLGRQVEVRAELLKDRVHAVKPDLLFGVYPAINETNWVNTGVMRAFGRNSYPVISFATDTYGYYSKPWGADRIPADLNAYFAKYDINGIYVAGYLFRKYTSSEIGAHLIQSCQRAQGYWLFSMRQLFEEGVPEGNPLAGGTQSDYLQAIKNANITLGTGISP